MLPARISGQGDNLHDTRRAVRMDCPLCAGAKTILSNSRMLDLDMPESDICRYVYIYIPSHSTCTNELELDINRISPYWTGTGVPTITLWSQKQFPAT
jgi:hypothetical protein